MSLDTKICEYVRETSVPRTTFCLMHKTELLITFKTVKLICIIVLGIKTLEISYIFKILNYAEYNRFSETMKTTLGIRKPMYLEPIIDAPRAVS